MTEKDLIGRSFMKKHDARETVRRKAEKPVEIRATKKQKAAKERTRIKRMLEIATVLRCSVDEKIERLSFMQENPAIERLDKIADRFVRFERRCMVALGTWPDGVQLDAQFRVASEIP